MAAIKRNILLSNTNESLPFVSKGTPGGKKKIPTRDEQRHANIIRNKFEKAYGQSFTQKQVAAIQYGEGTYLEFSGQEGHDLAIGSLENLTVGIRLLNIRVDKESDVIKATVYVPKGKEPYFIQKVDEYLTERSPKSGARKNQALINSIEDVKLALLESFWISKSAPIPTTAPVWCEIWLRVTGNDFDSVESIFRDACKQLAVKTNEDSIKFPERLVKLVFADAAQLSDLIASIPYVAEIRRAEEVASFFEELENAEQQEWANELLRRINFDFSNATICILDTGINSGHPLLEKAYEEDTVHSIENSWRSDDHYGHGTEMAGIALYHNLHEKLLLNDTISIQHRLESVKILPPSGNNNPNLYGSVTQRAVYLAEIAKPNSNRVICLAITSEKYNTGDGSPTSWSGAVDSLSSGEYGTEERRLFIISAGNVHPSEVKEAGFGTANTLHSIESPAQAWNALTVGAYCSSIQLKDELLENYSAVADVGELSPYSSSSELWDTKWPIKPDILCDGGNMATDGTNVTESADLSLLTTHFKPTVRLFTTTWGTSSAAAQASNIAARIMAEYPTAWPETVRALLVHSATWTPKMKEQYCKPDTKTKGRRRLLRNCGYGIPNLEKALQCMNNSVNMVIEGELQPFDKEHMNEMHLHKIPWPKEVLRSLGEIPATLRVTLSYFVEPGPGEIGWKDRYRYSSCGLRFEVINHNQSKEDFEKWVNVKMRGDDRKDKGEGSSGSEDWYLGTDNRDVGSIHSDFKTLNAVELCEAEYVAVYPVIGWWRERAYLKRSNERVRYSLIVTISTPEVDVDLYTPIITQIKQPVSIETRT